MARSKMFRSMIPGRDTRQSFKAVGRIWPNGEFSLGYVPENEETGPYEDGWLGKPGPSGLRAEADEMLVQLDLWEDEQVDADSVHGLPCTVPITLSDAPNPHEPPSRAKYGLNGLTATGRKMIRSGCYLLEKRLGKEDCVMITLTVPAIPRDSRIQLAKQWGVVTNRLVQYLSRELEQQGRSPTLIGCVEVQTGRLKKYSEAYLHLHLICPAHSNTGRFWAIEVGALRTWWAGQLERTVGHSLPHLPRVETAIVEKSCEAYLAKYLSKGNGEDMEAFIKDVGEDCIPGQWWFCSAPMRHAINAATLAGANCGAILEQLVEHLLDQGTGEGFEYIRHVDRIVGGRAITCGWVGRLTPELLSDMQLMLRIPLYG